MSSNCSVGDHLECLWSKRIHMQGIPLLIWPKLLRELGAGQLDLACIFPEKLQIIEVKSSGLISQSQLNRIRKSCEILSIWLDKQVELKLVGPNICQRESPFLSY